MILHDPEVSFIRRQLVLLLLIGLTAVQANAMPGNFGPGYVVTLNKDTLKGLVSIGDHTLNVKRCIFKETETGAETIYEPRDILAYGAQGNRLFRSFSRSVDGKEEEIFIERIMQGKISLFFNLEDFFIEHDNIIEQLAEVEKQITREGRIFLVKQPLYRATLQNAMHDCPNSFQAVNKVKLNRKMLINLIRQYYDCIGIKPSGSPVINEVVMRFGISAAATSSSWDWRSNGSPEYQFMDMNGCQATISLAPSLWIELWRPSVNNRLRLRTGLIYYSTSYYQTQQSFLSGLSHEMELKISRIEVPLQLKYFISRNGPFVTGGIAVGKVLSFDDKLTIKIYPKNAFFRENSSLNPTDLLIDFSAGLGYEWRLGARAIIFEAALNITSSITKSYSRSPSGGIRAFAFSVGVPLSKIR